MSRPRGQSQNRESQESRPGNPGAAFPGQYFSSTKARPLFIALLLALTTLLVYLPVARQGFSIFDDDDYVTANRFVQSGLTWAGVEWAFTTWRASNWHPLTWFSHMTDCQLFGLNPGAHHVVNALFHAANAALLFALLFRLTGGLWPGVFVAALFAWHPLRVESVAWVSERKDVLSTFFALLALRAYVAYVSHKPEGRTRLYLLSLLLFALGLMAKPMVVTLPFVMLLLDYWPLGRFPGATLRRLVLEKWPFFLLAAASGVVTFLAQHRGGMVVPLEEMPAAYRLENVPLAYLRYLLKIFWPVHLAIFYPLPRAISPATVFAAGAILVVVTALVWAGRKGGPHGLVGWLWFLGTLVPVIGLVQVGRAAMADRYTYFPSIGVFLALAFAGRAAIGRFRLPPPAVALAAILVLGSCVVLTERQLHYWRDDESLFSHAVNVTRDNEPAHLCLGQVYEMEGRQIEAVVEYRTALKLNPGRVKTYNSLALLLARSGRTDEALAELRRAQQLFPGDAVTRDTLANLLADTGHPDEALIEFRAAVRLDPGSATLRNNLGALLVELGRFDEAMDHYAAAARADPADGRAPYLTGKALLKQGRDAESIPFLRQALQIDPDNLQVLLYLARVLASDEDPKVRDGRTALVLASRANDLVGGMQPATLDVLAMAFAESGRFDEAQAAAQKALELARLSRMKNLESLQQRLQLYQSRQPWRESFRATNSVPETVP
jgi:protein O-mannosyl-transferase